MLQKAFFSVASLLLLAKVIAGVDTSAVGCGIDKTKLTVDGLVGNVYYYPWSSTHGEDVVSYQSAAYLAGGYAANPNLVTADDGHAFDEVATVAYDVSSTYLTFSYAPPPGEEVWIDQPRLLKDGSPVNIPVSNYVFSLNGYLIPNVTGVYTFNMGYTDDVAMFSIGDGHAPFGCCMSPQQSVGVSEANAQLKRAFPSGTDVKYQVELIAGFAYPVNFFYIQIDAHGDYSLYYTDPNGNTAYDWAGFAYSSYDLEQDDTCYVQSVFETTTQWTGTTTSYATIMTSSISTTTVPSSSTFPEVVKTVIFEDITITEFHPVSHQTTTSYFPYTGNETTTFSTEIKMIGTTGASVIYYVNVPYSTFASTSTSFYSGSLTTTVSTFITTITPSGNGSIPYVSSVFIVDVPEGHSTTNVYTPGTGSVPTTYSTDYNTVTGSNGTPTVDTTYYVQTPYSTSASTSTRFYSGSTTLTVSTFITTITPSGNGSTPYVSSVFIVDVPEGHSTTNVYTPGTGSVPITYSTDYNTVTGSNGTPTVDTTYYVQTPYSTSASTSVPWTGTFNTTLSKVSTFISSDNDPTTSTNYPIQTPEVDTITSTTQFWTGSSTKTITGYSTFTRNDSKVTVETIVTVDIPTFNKGWNMTSQGSTYYSTSIKTNTDTITCTDVECQSPSSATETVATPFESTSAVYETSTDLTTVTCTEVECQLSTTTVQPAKTTSSSTPPAISTFGSSASSSVTTVQIESDSANSGVILKFNAFLMGVLLLI